MKTSTLSWINALVSLIMLGLAFAALDDITTGREPEFYLEYTMLGIAGLWFVRLLMSAFQKSKPSRQPGLRT